MGQRQVKHRVRGQVHRRASAVAMAHNAATPRPLAKCGSAVEVLDKQQIEDPALALCQAGAHHRPYGQFAGHGTALISARSGRPAARRHHLAGLRALHRAARQIPGATVNRICQQHPARHADDQCSRRHALTSWRCHVLLSWPCPRRPVDPRHRRHGPTGAAPWGFKSVPWGSKSALKGRPGDQSCDCGSPTAQIHRFAGQAAPGTRSLTPRQHRALPRDGNGQP